MSNEKIETVNTVLIFETEYIVGLDLKRSLNEKGYKVYFESQLIEARELILAEQPDFVIVGASSIADLQHGTGRPSGGKMEKDNMAILDKKLRLLTLFRKPFHSEQLVSYLVDHLKQLG